MPISHSSSAGFKSKIDNEDRSTRFDTVSLPPARWAAELPTAKVPTQPAAAAAAAEVARFAAAIAVVQAAVVAVAVALAGTSR